MAETEIPPKSALELQIEMEAKELKDVPKIPIQNFMGGPVGRCCLCGRVVPISQLQDIDTHITPIGSATRKVCPDCYANAVR